VAIVSLFKRYRLKFNGRTHTRTDGQPEVPEAQKSFKCRKPTTSDGVDHNVRFQWDVSKLLLQVAFD